MEFEGVAGMGIDRSGVDAGQDRRSIAHSDMWCALD